MAEWKELPLTGDAYRNVDESQLDQIAPLVQDAYVDELGHTQKRPGLDEFVDLGTSAGVDGLFWWNAQSVAVAVSGGEVWKITDATGTKAQLTGATMTLGTRITFAPNGSTLVLANGSNMVTTDLSALTTISMSRGKSRALACDSKNRCTVVAQSYGSNTIVIPLARRLRGVERGQGVA